MEPFCFLQMIQDSPGSCHKDMRLFCDFQYLLHRVNTSIEDNRFELTPPCRLKPLEILVDLDAELPSWSDDQCHSIWDRSLFVLLLDEVQDRQDERQCFSASCLGQAQQVSVLKTVLECLALNFRRFLVTHFLQTIQNMLIEIELLEGVMLLSFRYLRLLLVCIGGFAESRLNVEEILFLEVERHSIILKQLLMAHYTIQSYRSRLLTYTMEEGDSNQNESGHSIKLEEEKSEEQSQRQEQSINKKRVHRKQEISNFIMKTYKILEDKRNSHIIEWTDNGSCFIVKNKDLFENQILPKYFKHKKFSSFVRQLNMYDFHKIRKEKEIPIFKHKFFRMGSYDLLHKIKRKSGEQGREDEPSRLLISNNEISARNDDIPLRSAVSIKSKIIHNANDDIEELIRQNQELMSSISDINKDLKGFQAAKSKKQEKLIKILSGLIYFDLGESDGNTEQGYTLRQLQNHFMNEEEPLSFSQYANKIGCLYRNIYSQMTDE